jgi:hypothetical protein
VNWLVDGNAVWIDCCMNGSIKWVTRFVAPPDGNPNASYWLNCDSSPRRNATQRKVSRRSAKQATQRNNALKPFKQLPDVHFNRDTSTAQKTAVPIASPDLRCFFQ